MGIYSLKIPQRDLYILLDRVKTGPLNLDQIREMYAQQRVDRSTPLWYPGLLNWVSVGDIPDFNRRENSLPPAAPKTVDSAALWIHFQEQVIAMTAKKVGQLVKDKKFRRGDYAYHAESKAWIRADQHPLLAEYFSVGVEIPKVKP